MLITPPDPQEEASFGELLGWHFLRGTRAGGRGGQTGRRWNAKEFAAALGVSDRTVRYWLNNRHLPTEIESIERVLFGDAVQSGMDWRLALRAAHRAPELKTSSSDFVCNLPYPSLSSLFKGRTDLFGDIEKHHASTVGSSQVVVQALYGLGGVGKTRAAVEYAHRRRSQYSAILFFVANSPEALRHNLAGLADSVALDLPKKTVREQHIRLNAVLAWLVAQSGWLIIFDGVDSREAMTELHSVIGRLGGGHAIITSRLASFAAYVEPFRVDVLPSNDATAFLLERTSRRRRKERDDKHIAAKLGDDVGALPLALEQASAFIEREELSFAQYRSLWQQHWERVAHWTDACVTHYPYALAVTWQTSTYALSEAARNFLWRLAWLAPQPIPEFLFESSITDAAGPIIDDKTADALNDLADASIVRRDRTRGELCLHLLVQDVTRRNLGDAAGPPILKETLAWFDAKFEGDPEEIPARARLDRLRLHAAALIIHADDLDLGEAAAALMAKLGVYLVSKALYAEARRFLERALAIQERHLGDMHLDTAKTLMCLAGLHQAEGDLAGARTMAERVLAIREAVLGPEHPDVATVLNNLHGGLVRAQGDLDGALACCRRALAINEKAFGADHPATARSLNDVSSVLRCQGKLAEAKQLCKRALAIRERSLAPTHVDVARSLTSLALIHDAEGDAADALPLHERALAIREAVFGPEHPLTARSLHNLAGTLAALGRPARARALLLRAIDIREKILGAEHPDTLASRERLGSRDSPMRPSGPSSV